MDNDENGKDSYRLIGISCLSILCGVLTYIVSDAATKDEAVQTVDHLVKLDMGYESRFVFTTSNIFNALRVGSLFVVTSGLIGIYAALTRRKGCVALTGVSSTLFGIVMVFAGVQALLRRNIVEPLVARQVNDFCNASTYIRLVMNIQCPWAPAMYMQEVPACGPICKHRVDMLRQLEGCSLLLTLCKHGVYQEQDTDSCEAIIGQQDGPVMYAANYSQGYGDGDLTSSCRLSCDEDIVCSGFLYKPEQEGRPAQCLLSSGLPVRHPYPEWMAVERRQVAFYLYNFSSSPILTRCYSRTHPVVLERFVEFGRTLALATSALGIVLLVNSFISCFFLHDLHVRRKGRTNAAGICCMMVCPCCYGDRRYGMVLSDDSDDDLGDHSSREVRFTQGFHGPASSHGGPVIHGTSYPAQYAGLGAAPGGGPHGWYSPS